MIKFAQSDTVGGLAKALAKAQGEFPIIPKNHTAKIASDKGKYEYAYADIADVLLAIRPVLAKHGIALLQVPQPSDGQMELYTRLMFGDEWMACSYPVCSLARDQDHKKVGAAMTYARRYALTSFVGVASEEDTDDQGDIAARTAGRQDRPIERSPSFFAWSQSIQRAETQADLTEVGKAMDKDDALPTVDAYALLPILRERRAELKAAAEAKPPAQEDEWPEDDTVGVTDHKGMLAAEKEEPRRGLAETEWMKNIDECRNNAQLDQLRDMLMLADIEADEFGRLMRHIESRRRRRSSKGEEHAPIETSTPDEPPVTETEPTATHGGDPDWPPLTEQHSADLATDFITEFGSAEYDGPGGLEALRAFYDDNARWYVDHPGTGSFSVAQAIAIEDAFNERVAAL